MGDGTRPTVSQAEQWRPDDLRDAADKLCAAAADMNERIDVTVRGVVGTHDFWTGSAAESARRRALSVNRESDLVARAAVTAAVAAYDGAQQIAAARDDVLARVAGARSEGFAVGDDGSVSVAAGPAPLLVALSGGDDGVAHVMLTARAAELGTQIVEALDRLGAADADAGHDIAEALAAPVPPAPSTTPAGAWPVRAGDVVAGWPALSQDRIAGEIAAMTPEQRHRLVTEFPQQVGNTDGVPWSMRVEANRINVAQAILDERDPARLAVYRDLLAEVDDPAGGGRRIDRQILAFDPARASLVELHGDIATATSVAVLVPGLNTTIAGSPAVNETARRFVSASRGEVALISYLGGPFPRGDNPASALVSAADPRYALRMAPRLVAFSEDVDRTVDSTGRPVPVTFIGHSYGGSILGTAEALGLTADRTLYVAAAGAGVGVDDPADWHNRNPDVLRFSMTAPGDFIQTVQGIPGGPHGADPDEMPGVIHLATGHYDDGRLMAGPRAHSDVLNRPSDSWRNILGVITGDRAAIRLAG
ncbi:alpha/beta hydrolase [Mycolicibacterium holsaticum]|uniref:alpha/beta hydrolase n=1 Tax=Mycolicibacterium holsaticum TaxID=152142 RepID=UPI001C7DED5F|nr:alpha/beta hydrolase [Mycolicibacterium holsaticum]MDA4107899.1 alpha/beta hydrolase [Mycolicibacterium holsaticum DSM 44478 = JCM 12374]QZA14669.1 alpha/beta hydrolase family protein [Mycolicibacterium holsaticum DSM 44478 = JCM 12374]UNC07886.1 alpha/beta hydrolase [Mycolicibacterium holsaticum DSM 44478 = JCM 12374]